MTEGFTGNIALKTAEGTAKQIAAYLRAGAEREAADQTRRSHRARGLRRTLKAKWTRAKSMARVFLGLDGVVIKSHGGLDADGFAGAIEIGYDMVRHGLLDKIRDMMSLADETAAGPPTAGAPPATRIGMKSQTNRTDPTVNA